MSIDRLCNRAVVAVRARARRLLVIARDRQGAAPIVANVRLTKAQRTHIQLYTVVPVAYRQTVEAPGTVDFDNDQATGRARRSPAR